MVDINPRSIDEELGDGAAMIKDAAMIARWAAQVRGVPNNEIHVAEATAIGTAAAELAAERRERNSRG